jgi:hypothetical protein
MLRWMARRAEGGGEVENLKPWPPQRLKLGQTCSERYPRVGSSWRLAVARLFATAKSGEVREKGKERRERKARGNAHREGCWNKNK